MKTVILLRGGCHPASLAPRPAPLEVQAIGLARGLGATLIGLAAVPREARDQLALYGGHGLGRLVHLPLPAGADPLPALAAWLAAEKPDLILAGRRSEVGRGRGLLPYRLAAALGLPLAADVIAARLAEAPNALALTLYRPRGARLALTARLPLVLTLHPAAPVGPAFAHGRMRHLRIEEHAVSPGVEEKASSSLIPPPPRRPYRPRPRLLPTPQAGDAAARRAALTGLGQKTRRIEAVSPEEAADRLLEALAALGLAPPPGDPSRPDTPRPEHRFADIEETLAPHDIQP
jgi:electron transfer flavoprotein beta subunit